MEYVLLADLLIFLILAVIISAMGLTEKSRERRNTVNRLMDGLRFNTDPKNRKKFIKGLYFLTAYIPDYKNAAKTFKNIMRRTPDPLDKAYCADWLGKCGEALGDDEIAAGYYAVAAEVAPSDIYALNKLANYYHNDEYEKAEYFYKRVLFYDPASSDVYYRLGKLYSRYGEADKAIEQYALAIKTNNGYVAPMAETAIEYAKKGDKKNILKYFLLAAANDLHEFDKLEEAIKECLS
jgi:tetratricopeptide (TPR) repeat protein